MDSNGYDPLAEIAEAIASEGPAPTDLVIVLLRCPSGFIGEMINGRFLLTPCRGSRCKVRGAKHTDHLIDTATGRMTTIGDAARHTGLQGLLAASTLFEEASHGGIR